MYVCAVEGVGEICMLCVAHIFEMCMPLKSFGHIEIIALKMIFYTLAMANAEHVKIQTSNKIAFWGKKEKNYCNTNQSFCLFMCASACVCVCCANIQFLVDRAQVVLGKSLALIVLALEMYMLNFG